MRHLAGQADLLDRRRGVAFITGRNQKEAEAMSRSIRVQYDLAREQYAVYCGQEFLGFALDVQAVGDFVHNLSAKQNITSKSGDNESSGRATNSAAQKSQ